MEAKKKKTGLIFTIVSYVKYLTNNCSRFYYQLPKSLHVHKILSAEFGYLFEGS